MSSFVYSWLPKEGLSGRSVDSAFSKLSSLSLFLSSCLVLTLLFIYAASSVIRVSHLQQLRDPIGEKVSGLDGLSFHKCIGHGFSSRSCVFYSVTYNVAQQRFEYFNPLKNYIVNIESHSAMDEFPANFITLKSMKHRDTKLWTIKRLKEKLPYIPAKCVVKPRVLFWQSMAVLSVGHTLADDLFGSFRVLQSLGLNPMEYIRVILHESRCTTQACRRMSNLWYPSISGEPLQYWDEFLTEVKGCSQVLFKELVVGGGGSGISLGNLRFERKYASKSDQKPIGARLLSETWSKFRNQVFVKLNLDEDIFPYADKQQKITIFNKTRTDRTGNKVLSHRSIQNIDEISSALSKAFPNTLINVVDPSNYKSFYEEVKELSGTTILITPPGSVQYTAIFLPPGAFLIGIDSCFTENKECTGGNDEIEHVFAHISYLNTLRYTRKGERVMYLDKDRVILLVKQALMSYFHINRHEARQNRKFTSSKSLPGLPGYRKYFMDNFQLFLNS
jgi:hypothetical protein